MLPAIGSRVDVIDEVRAVPTIRRRASGVSIQRRYPTVRRPRREVAVLNDPFAPRAVHLGRLRGSLRGAYRSEEILRQVEGQLAAVVTRGR